MSITPRIVITEDTLLPRLMTMDTLIRKGIQTTMHYYEPIAEAKLKEKAPWTDRTGNARIGLSAKAFENGDDYSLVLFHQVPYGIYLETKNSGKYRVIMPTAQEVGKQIVGTVNKILAGLGVDVRASLV